MKSRSRLQFEEHRADGSEEETNYSFPVLNASCKIAQSLRTTRPSFSIRFKTASRVPSEHVRRSFKSSEDIYPLSLNTDTMCSSPRPPKNCWTDPGVTGTCFCRFNLEGELSESSESHISITQRFALAEEEIDGGPELEHACTEKYCQ